MTEKFNAPPNSIESPENKLERLKVQFDIFYSSHTSAEDLSGFKERLNKSDILLIEMAGWARQDMEFIEDISAGKTAKARHKNDLGPPSEFHKQLIQDISGSGKVVLSPDLPIENANVEAFETLSAEFSYALRHFFEKKNRTSKDLENTRNDMANIIKGLAKINKKREEYILNHLDETIEKALMIQPKLKEKDEIKVLMFFGAAHSSIFHQMRKDDRNVASSFNPMPFSYEYFSQMLRAEIFNKKITDELALNILLEELLLSVIKKKGHKLAASRKITPKIVAKLNKEEIESILLDNDTKPGESPKLLQILQDKKIDIPELNK